MSLPITVIEFLSDSKICIYIINLIKLQSIHHRQSLSVHYYHMVLTHNEILRLHQSTSDIVEVYLLNCFSISKTVPLTSILISFCTVTGHSDTI